MKIQILGCTGGIGPGLRTTSMLIDNDILIDCGSGVGDLSQEEQNAIRHIFLTHGHLDHIAFIPFLLDSAFDAYVNNPLTIHLQAKTLDMLQQHIFNWKIWPDFAKLPDANNPVVQYDVITPEDKRVIGDRIIEAIPVTHTQPAVGYRVQSPAGGSFAFSGDTKSTDRFWEVLNSHSNLDVLVIECSYPDREVALSNTAGHHRPSTLAEDIGKLRHQPDLYISHLKPGEEALIMDELSNLIGDNRAQILLRGQVFEL